MLDFFVLRRESVGWQEWKQAGTGQWHCPPGEAYAAHLGVTYRLRSSAEFHPLEIQKRWVKRAITWKLFDV